MIYGCELYSVLKKSQELMSYWEIEFFLQSCSQRDWLAIELHQ